MDFFSETSRRMERKMQIGICPCRNRPEAVPTPARGTVASFAKLAETDEMERAADLLDALRDPEPRLRVTGLVARELAAAGGAGAAESLLAIVCRLATAALVGVRSNTLAGAGTTAPADLLGIEVEGMSPEDAEFEIARRILRFACEAAGREAALRGSLPPPEATRRALGAAAQRWVPGLVRTSAARAWTPRRSAPAGPQPLP